MTSLDTVKSAVKSAFLLVTYFTSWNVDTMSPFAVPAKCLTHLNYAFAMIENGIIVDGDPDTDSEQTFQNPSWVPGAPKTFRGAIDALTHPQSPVTRCNPNLKKLISVGGWTHSDQFSLVARSAANRTKFAASVIDYLVRHRLDGIDINWEHPVEDGDPNNARSPADRANFVLLLKEIRAQMDCYEREHRRPTRFLITTATTVSNNLIKNLDLKGMADVVDWFNLMIYDFAGPWENVTMHDAPYQTAFQDAVRLYRSRHVPASKLVAGVPLYGLRYHGVSGEGAGRPYQSVDDQIGYDEIIRTLTPDLGYDVQWDRQAAAGYLWNADRAEFVTYEDPQSVALKAAYARNHSLGGLFMWEASYDRDAVALGKIRQVLGRDRPHHECFCN